MSTTLRSRRAAWAWRLAGAAALGSGLTGACRGSTATGDASIDADVPSLSSGVAIGFFGAPAPDNGIPDPVFFVGCPKAGFAAAELYYLQPDGSVIDDSSQVAAFTRDGVHDHVDIGSGSLVADVDEQGADPGSAPFVYAAMVTSDQRLLDTLEHTFSAHVLNPAAPAMDTLGAWNSFTLVTCP